MGKHQHAQRSPAQRERRDARFNGGVVVAELHVVPLQRHGLGGHLGAARCAGWLGRRPERPHRRGQQGEGADAGDVDCRDARAQLGVRQHVGDGGGGCGGTCHVCGHEHVRGRHDVGDTLLGGRLALGLGFRLARTRRGRCAGAAAPHKLHAVARQRHVRRGRFHGRPCHDDGCGGGVADHHCGRRVGRRAQRRHQLRRQRHGPDAKLVQRVHHELVRGARLQSEHDRLRHAHTQVVGVLIIAAGAAP